MLSRISGSSPTLKAIATAACSIWLWATPAEACVPLEAFKKAVWTQYKEALVSMALASNGMMTQLFMSKRGETWTFIAVDPKTKCTTAIAAGTDWQGVTFKAPEQKS